MNPKAFCDAYCTNLKLTEIPIGYVLKTPFTKDNGDSISIYLRRNEKNRSLYRMEDDGETIAALESQGVDFDSESRFEALVALLSQHHARLDEANSLLHTDYFSESQIAEKSLLFLSLLNRVGDLSLLAKTRVRSTFKEDLLSLVESQFVGARIRVDEPLKSAMKDYIIDIIVESSDGRALAIFAGTSELKALEALLFTKEKREQNVLNTRAMLVLQEAKPREIKERTLSRVINSDILLASMDGEAVAVKQKMAESLLEK